MKTTISFPMEWNDFRLLGEVKEAVGISFGGRVVAGQIYPKTYYATGEAECELLESQEQPRITIPVKSLKVHYDYRDDVQVVYGIGDSTPVYITAADRRRYRDLEGLRIYRGLLKNCVTDRAYYDEWDGKYVMCNHGPEEHDADGCNATVDWYEGSRIYCGCECYTKPAPLMRIV